MALFVVGGNVAKWFEEVNVFILLMEIKIILEGIIFLQKRHSYMCIALLTKNFRRALSSNFPSFSLVHCGF